MSFARPEMLWLLALLPAVAWLHVRVRRTRIDAGTSWAVLALRLVVFGALIVALARPSSVVDRERAMRVIAVDVSESTGDVGALDARVRTLVDEARGDDCDVRIVAFAERAREIVPAPRTGVFPAIDREGVGRVDRTDIGAGLALAQTLVPPGVPAGVSLVGDGRDSRGFAPDEVERLVARGIALDVHPIGAGIEKPVFTALDAPAAARVGETVAIRIRVGGLGREDRLFARVETEANPGTPTAITVDRGVAEPTLQHEVDRAGIHALRVVVERADGAKVAERSAAILGRKPLVVRLVEARGAPTQRDALQQMLGKAATIDVVEAETLDARTDWRGADFVITANVPASSFQPNALEHLATAVEDGLGLLVCGGERSFGLGGYSNTPLERILPVRFQQKEERRDPSATLVIIIDTSGSMGGTRIDLAKEVARLALKRLKPHDKAGIVEFHGAKRWAAPIQSASNGVDIQRALNRLNAGGGTVILPAIEESYYGLLNVRTRTRHVLVLTDGGVEQGPFESVVRKLSQHGMTLSTVLVGPGTHSSFLVNLAQWGRGRYYHAPDRFNLPEVIVKQPESSLLSPAIEEPTALEVVGDSFIRRDIGLDDAPPVRGVLDVEAKATAETMLATARGESLLTRWRYGLGQVAAWTTELAGPWTADLAQWRGYAALVGGMVRDGRRTAGADGISVRADVRGERVHVFAWRDDATDRSPIDLAIGGVRRRITPTPGSDRLAPYGVWAAPTAGVVPIEVVTTDGVRAVGASFIPPTTEFTEREAASERMAAWAAWTGGRADGRSTAPKPATVAATAERWPVWLWIALIAFLASVFVRRRAPAGAAAAAVFLSAALATFVPVDSSTLAAQEAAPTNGAPANGATANGAEHATISDDVRRLMDAVVADPSTRQHAVAEAVRIVRLEAGELDRLIDYLRERSVREPRLAPVLARVAAIDGKPDVVEKTLRSLDAADKLDGDGAMEYARVLEVLGRDDEALAMLDRALTLTTNPGLAIALRIRRASLLLSRETTHARGVEAIRQLAEQAPPRSDYRSYLGLLGALHGAPDLLLSSPARTGDPKTRYRDLLLRGTFHLRADRKAEAKTDFGEAMAAAGLDRDRRYAQERLIATHRADGTLGRLADAWIASDDRSPARIDALVALLRELKRPAEAFDLLLAGKGLENTEKKTRAFRTLQREIIGLALECGRPKEVERIYRALIVREPSRTEWWSGLALLYLLRGERTRGAVVFDEAIAKNAGNGKILIQLAEAAHELSLRPQMERAAEGAIEVGGRFALRAKLMLADRAFERGESKVAVEALKSLEKDFPDQAPALAQIAEAYERFGVLDDSIRILRALKKKQPTEDMLMRLAWLLQGKGKKEAAAAVWADLWKTTKLPARVRQAEDRMLDMASNNGKLADFAINLEEKLDEKKGTFRDLALLVKLYTRANDTVSAIEVLRLYGPQVGRGALETMQNMAHVYQHCEDYRKYEETLLELQKLDPANATDYQQQIAIGALERGRGRQAKRAIERLRKIAPGSLDADEFAAGVLAMIGLPEDAVRAYTRVVTAHPNRIESFLMLGNALRSCGRTKQAHYIFLDLMENAEKDDLFTIAVDGLLNLNAGSAILRVAERRVFERIAQRPKKAFLYQLAADLAEELREQDRHVDMIALMALVAGDRRSAVLRELMDLESARGKYPAMIGYGRSLLALGEEMPPQVFLDLGKALINVDDLPTAERVFARTRIAGDYTAMQKQIAEFYAEANFAAAAARILRQTLLARPDDAELLTRVGQLTTESGDYAQASRDFLRAHDQLMARSPRTKAKSTRRRGFNRNRSAAADPFKAHGDVVQRGLLFVSDPPGRALVGMLRERMVAEVDAVRAAEKKLKKTADYPRLSRLHEMAQRAALAFGLYDEMDAIDETILTHFAKDTAVKGAMIRLRENRGAIGRATAMAKRQKKDPPSGIRSANALAAPVDIDALFEDEKLGVADLIRYVQLLIALGEPSSAYEVLDNVDTSAKMTASQAGALTRLAFALERRDLIPVFLDRWIEKVAKGNVRTIETGLNAALALSWGSLSIPQRVALGARLRQLAETAGEKKSVRIRAFLHRHQHVLGGAATVDASVFEGLIDSGPKYIGSVAPILRIAPAGMRASLFRRALDRIREPRKYQFLTFVSSLGDAATGELGEALVTAFRESKNDPNFRAATYAYSIARMIDSGIDPAVGRALVAHLRTEFPEESIFDLAASILAAYAADADADVEAAEEALYRGVDAMAARPKMQGFDRTLIGFLCSSEKPVVRRVVDRVLAEPKETPGWVALETARLTRRAHQAQIGARLRELRAKYPDNRMIRSQFLTHLRAQGRANEAARRLEESLSGAAADNTYPYTTVASDYRRAGRPALALEAARKVKTRYVDRRIRQTLLQELGRDREAERLFLRTRMASRSRSLVVFGRGSLAPLGRGGLASTSPGTRSAAAIAGAIFSSSIRQTRGLDEIANQPWGHRMLEREWRASALGRGKGDRLAKSLAAARWIAWGDAKARARLKAAIAAGELSVEDRALLWVALEKRGASLEDEVPGALAAARRAAIVEGNIASPAWSTWRDVTDGDPTRSFYAMDRYTLAGTLIARGRVLGGGPVETKGPFDRLLDYAAPSRRSRALRALLRETAGCSFNASEASLRLSLAQFQGWDRLGVTAERERARGRVNACLAALPDYLRKGPAANRARAVLALADGGDGTLEALGDSRPAIRSLMPNPKQVDDPRDVATRAWRALESAFAGRSPERFRPGLAGWLIEAGATDAARAMIAPLDAAARAALDANERLTVADVARKVGDDDLAYRIEAALFREGGLNALRLGDHLAAVETREGRGAYARAVRHAVESTDRPEVLERAIALERTEGNAKVVDRLLDRLAAVAPDHSLVAGRSRG